MEYTPILNLKTTLLSIHTGNIYSYKACVILSLNVPPNLSANFKLLFRVQSQNLSIFRFFANFNFENFDFQKHYFLENFSLKYLHNSNKGFIFVSVKQKDNRVMKKKFSKNFVD